jgi:hypothetical protein
MIEYRQVLVTWHDDDAQDEMLTKVCINKDWTEGEDDTDVFFYFTNLNELEQAKQPEPNGFEFRLREEK